MHTIESQIYKMNIRPAKPQDAEQIFNLIYSSGPNAFDFVFSENDTLESKDFLRSTFETNLGTFSHQTHFVVEDPSLDSNRNIVASLMVKSKDQLTRHMLGDMRAILKFYGLFSALKVMIRGLKVETMIKPPVKGRLYVGHLGVSPSLQGQGIGKLMIQKAEELAKDKDLSHLSLDVSLQNPNAERLYQKLGFEVKALNPFKYNKHGSPKVPDHHYMEKAL
mgnify:CR=1 FL=1